MVNYRGVLLKVSFIIAFCNNILSHGQQRVNLIDSLKNKTYNELFISLNKSENLEQKELYANYIIKKAKKEKNDKLLLAGYHTQAIVNNNTLLLKYCDSIIELTELKSDKTYPAHAYQLKGDYYFNLRDYKKALENYLKVSNYANKHKNKILIFKSKDNIGSIKRKIGEKEAALKLFKENFLYAKENLEEIEISSYLNSISAIANIYNDLNLPDSSSYYNRIGLMESNKYNDVWSSHHFSLNEGLSLYHNESYFEAIDSIEKHIPYFENTEHKTNLSLAYYYCGKSYEKINKPKKAIVYYKKVDTIFQKVNSIYPNARKAYVQLINYFKQENDIENQLLYINQLIKVDSIFHSEEIYLNKGIFKEYDIPKLSKEKQDIINKMENDELKFNKIILLISIILLLSLIVLVYQYQLRRRYKKKFKAIIDSEKSSATTYIKVKQIEISEEIIKGILRKLNTFEKNNSFISKNLTLSSLANELNTNTNYLSKVINSYKNYSFSNYLNTLRIEYIINELKTNPNIRKYTVKAIADEAGFGNAESFSKAFYKIKEIKPSYFIRELNKI